MKKLKNIIATLSAVATLAIIPTTSAFAAYYSTSFYRGNRYVSYCQTDFYWEVDSKYNISSSSASQWVSGFAMHTGKTTRIYTGKIEHDWCTTCQQKFGIGKLFYTVSYSDNIALTNSGNSWKIK